MRTAIVADAGRDIGLGHMGRCMALAQALERFHRVKPAFITEDAPTREWIRAKGFGAQTRLTGRWDLLIADSYRFRPSDYLKFRRTARVFCVIDDLGRVRCPCDFVLNSAVFAQDVSYARTPAAGFLLGPKFHPLRKEYLAPPAEKAVRRTVKTALVVLGGANGRGLLERAVETARQALPFVRLHVVAGPYVPVQVRTGDPRIILHRSPPNMRALLETCDLAVSGGGQTLYELAYMGVPTVAIQLADNQRRNMEGFARAGAIIPAGEIESAALLRRVGAAVKRLAGRPAFRRKMSLQGRRLVDGRGARRVADALMGELSHA
ncbi:MAG: hypothetical protein HY548_07640 [Elusimicrobia bacterium]|nr:hypothetical protein [Elusimicrobiota bacterium]